MKNNHVLEQLSSYLDNQLNTAEKNAVEEHLKSCAQCAKEYKNLKLVSEKLKIWHEPELGPFFEKGVMEKIASQEPKKEEAKMKTTPSGEKVLVGVLTTIIILSVVAMQSYVKRAVNARIKGGTDYMISQTHGFGSNRQYEPYYLNQINDPAITKKIPAIWKLIKNAQIELVVKNCEQAAKEISAIATRYQGYVLNSNIQRFSDGPKRGTTVFKVLPQNLEKALEDLKQLGKADSEKVTGDDVTEEYVDLQARLKNTQAVRQRMLAILEQKAKNVKDILEVERELARLGEEIERIEGRLKYLDTQVELSTVTVNYYEPKAISPQPLKIAEKFKDTMRQAIETFIGVFNGVIVFLAGLLPIVIWVVVIGGIVIGVRKLFKK